MRSVIIFVLLLFFSLQFLAAAYLENVPQKLMQPDGSAVECLASGDEYHNWLHDEKGYTIIRDPATGYLVYADLAGGEIVPSPYQLGQIDPTAAGLSPGINLTPEQMLEKRSLRRSEWQPPEDFRAPTIGEINNLVVFIRFADQSEYTNSLAGYNNSFNAATGVSMKNYFQEVSGNQLDITTYFYPQPAGDLVISYQDSYNRNYYEVYDAVTNPDGYQGDTQRRQREHTLLRDAVNYVAGQIPADLELDNDNDGKVDNVCFIIQGSTEGWAELLWPHMWSLYTYSVYLNGSRVYAYNFQLSACFGVSVLCHEMFHSLGAPDLYHYSSDGLHPVGGWDLMASNSNPPQHMGAYMKWRYGNWFPTLPEITGDGTYSLPPLSTSPFACYKIPSPHSATEYFLVEYRRDEGTFESGIANSGLLVYRINPSYNGNASGPPDEVYIYRPNGTPTNNGFVNSATFAANYSRTQINDSTNPSSFLSDGTAGGLQLFDIGSTGSTIQFSYGEPQPEIAVSPSTLNQFLTTGSTDVQYLTISNTGSSGSLLDYAIDFPGSGWLSVDPVSGSLNAGNSDQIEVSFDAENLAPGTYQAAVDISHNAGELVSIPVELTVELAQYTISGWLSLTGQSLGGVTVTGVNTSPAEIITGPDGVYSFTASAGSSSEITPWKEGYDFTPTSFSGIITADIIQDFTAEEWVPASPANGQPAGTGVPIATEYLSWDAAGGSIPVSHYQITLSVMPDYSSPLIDDITTENYYPLAGITLISGQQYYARVISVYLPPTRGNSVPLEWDFTMEIVSLSISGSVTLDGSPLAGVLLAGTNTDQPEFLTETEGLYEFTADYGSSITVTPQKTGYDFEPVSFSVLELTTDQIQDFTATEWVPQPPSNGQPSGDLISPEVAALTWDVPAGTVPVTRYLVTLAANQDYNDPLVDDITSENQYSLSGLLLDNAQEYFVRVRAEYLPPDSTGRGLSAALEWSFTTEPAAVVISGEVFHNGSPLANVTIYGINTEPAEVQTGEDGFYSLSCPFRGEVTLIPECTGYYFSPDSYYNPEVTGYINQDFLAEEWAPEQPLNGQPAGTGIQLENLTLSWQPPVGDIPVHEYQVTLSANANFLLPVLDILTTATSLPVYELNLSYGASYYVRVIALYNPPARGASQPLIWSFTTESLYKTVSGYILEGDLGVKDVLVYNDVQTDRYGFYTFSVTDGSAALLLPLKLNYEFTPASLLLADIQEDTEVNFSAQKMPPLAPAQVSSCLTNNELVLNWDPVPGATAYKVYAAATPDGTFSLLTTVFTNSWSAPLTEQMRFYRITAIN